MRVSPSPFEVGTSSKTCDVEAGESKIPRRVGLSTPQHFRPRSPSKPAEKCSFVPAAGTSFGNPEGPDLPETHVLFDRAFFDLDWSLVGKLDPRPFASGGANPDRQRSIEQRTGRDGDRRHRASRRWVGHARRRGPARGRGRLHRTDRRLRRRQAAALRRHPLPRERARQRGPRHRDRPRDRGRIPATSLIAATGYFSRFKTATALLPAETA